MTPNLKNSDPGPPHRSTRPTQIREAEGGSTGLSAWSSGVKPQLSMLEYDKQLYSEPELATRVLSCAILQIRKLRPWEGKGVTLNHRISRIKIPQANHLAPKRQGSGYRVFQTITPAAASLVVAVQGRYCCHLKRPHSWRREPAREPATPSCHPSPIPSPLCLSSQP